MAAFIASRVDYCNAKLLSCIREIDSWMSSNRLKLNADKTEFMCPGTRQQLSKIDNQPLHVGGQFLSPSNSARSLGVVIDG